MNGTVPENLVVSKIADRQELAQNPKTKRIEEHWINLTADGQIR